MWRACSCPLIVVEHTECTSRVMTEVGAPVLQRCVAKAQLQLNRPRQQLHHYYLRRVDGGVASTTSPARGRPGPLCPQRLP